MVNYLLVFYNRLREQINPHELNSWDDNNRLGYVGFYIRVNAKVYTYYLNSLELFSAKDPLAYIDNEIKIIKEQLGV